MSSARNSGFTMIEALAAIVLLGIGIAAVMGGLGSMARTERMRAENDLAHRLAARQLNELIATDPLESPLIEGDFEEAGYPDYTWAVDVAPTGTEGLNVVRLVVRAPSDTDEPSAILETLVYQSTTTEEATP